jgi:sulfate adenylyltransferase subunit 2
MQEQKLLDDHLDWLEAESIYIIREVVAQCANPAMLFSGGKDSIVMFHLARKAFQFGDRPVKLPFPILHIDTGHNYPEVIAYRDAVVEKTGVKLIVGHVEDSIKKGTVRLRKETDSRNAAQAVTLLEAIAEHEFDALMGGARRDEEKARAKERIFSFRDEFGQWDPKAQRPELWNLYNARIAKGENMRVFPISNKRTVLFMKLSIPAIAIPGFGSIQNIRAMHEPAFTTRNINLRLT